jgi:hypothetical protein
LDAGDATSRRAADMARKVMDKGIPLLIGGESGVGKSSLLICMAALDDWSSGSIHHDGLDLGTLNETQRAHWRREQLGFVFQAFHVLPHLDVAQNVGLPLLLPEPLKLAEAEPPPAAQTPEAPPETQAPEAPPAPPPSPAVALPAPESPDTEPPVPEPSAVEAVAVEPEQPPEEAEGSDLDQEIS